MQPKQGTHGVHVKRQLMASSLQQFWAAVCAAMPAGAKLMKGGAPEEGDVRRGAPDQRAVIIGSAGGLAQLGEFSDFIGRIRIFLCIQHALNVVPGDTVKIPDIDLSRVARLWYRGCRWQILNIPELPVLTAAEQNHHGAYAQHFDSSHNPPSLLLETICKVLLQWVRAATGG